MIRRIYILLLLLAAFLADAGYYADGFPYAPGAGAPGTTAIHKDDPSFVAWADGYEDYLFGTHLAPNWKTPAKALGQAEGLVGEVVSLGRGGSITLTLAAGIRNGSGADFAVFENGFEDTFLELAYVEVSSDGTNFVRFPGYSFTPDPVDAFGEINPTYVTGFAGKYRQAYGAPFDLDDLQRAYDSQLAGKTDFSPAFASALLAAFPLLDLQHVTHVRLVDVLGDGSMFDAAGFAVYDPYPTTASAGFDLDAVGVINQPVQPGAPQAITFDPIPHQRQSFGSVGLGAVSDSGLPVQYSVQSGNASLDGDMLSFSSTGWVEVVASQPGDATYAPAAPVLRSFMVAEEIQHIFVEQVPNQIRGGADVQLHAYSSSGLPVGVEVVEAPENVVVDSNLVMAVGNETGLVTLRAFQPGTANVAPAEDVSIRFGIVEAGASNAPVPLASWLAFNAVPELAVSSAEDAHGRPSVLLDYTFDRTLAAHSRIIQSHNLLNWESSVPEILDQTENGSLIHLKLQVLAASTNAYFRHLLEAQ